MDVIVYSTLSPTFTVACCSFLASVLASLIPLIFLPIVTSSFFGVATTSYTHEVVGLVAVSPNFVVVFACGIATKNGVLATYLVFPVESVGVFVSTTR